MSKKTRLELTWIGKDERPRLEPRILIEDAELSHHASARGPEADIFDNILIQGDNLLALKALEAEYAARVKCVFIDPPYNTGSAFEHYDDGIEHSLWLSLIRDRLQMIHRLLSDDGSLWITIDDNEAHYLKVLCDEIFGRKNFLCTIAWQKIYTTKNSAKHFSGMHDHILVYAKDESLWHRNDLPRTEKQDAAYKNQDNDQRGVWKATPIHARNFYSKGLYSIESPSGRVIEGPPKGTYWRVSESRFHALDADRQIWWGENGDNIPAQKRFLTDVQGGVVPSTWWTYEDAGHNAEAKSEVRSLSTIESDLFITPKPERLIRRVLEIATNPGDLVLDSFAGSGTTGAVAHKMGRRWIMIELGDHAVTHIVPRLRKVVDGNDPGGVTEATGWKGGGGFRFYRLAPSLLEKDRFGNWVIAKEYNAAMLAEALCKHLGFTYSPSQDPAEYWRHGHSTETDFIYVTTQSLTYDALKKLSEEVGPKRTLLVCCKAFNAKEDSFPNLTVKKIPHSILAKCEWGRDDYSLRIANLPEKVDSVEAAEPADNVGEPKRGKAEATLPLFDTAGGK
ncbi:site-specific DNA-methyltransferase [Mesorhizobium sp. B4-1-4]|uniref:site-specific DNA-methyltransferase n=1 Tax=Mesorhizobium sp. B4-1-4 TaxID=2589888 RepID=UPI00112D767E|nr:site-specific DNA-methyltransferase [Mesorhizobium sp. B4-1-4]UCI29452.1 site-specific DNA-methyltransferase [Mesorhizobium sp. B4-1-4]